MHDPQPTPQPLPAEIPTAIPEQVRLPLRVALDIVLQGLRIRFGRSLVTLAGVALGIAFLMSNAALFYARQAVASEQRKREEATRMVNFLRAELGSPAGRTFRIHAMGAPRDGDLHFVRRLLQEGAASLQWVGTPPPAEFARERRIFVTSANTPPNDVEPRAVILLGAQATPSTLAAGDAGLPHVMLTELPRDLAPGGAPWITLARAPDPEEQARQASEQRQARFRATWILVIALLVTMMGIGNAMLMSVTERFREIGTMKCLGARARFIRQIFLLESALIGCLGGLAGALFGMLLPVLIYALLYGFGLIFGSLDYLGLGLAMLAAVAIGIVLSVLAALYPATVAARMVPAVALRSSV